MTPGRAPTEAGERPKAGPRDTLLAAVVEHFAQHGIGDTSLRGIAEAVGTSHRMLIYHFGSREGLLVEVTRAVEAQQRSVMTATYDTDLPPLEAAALYWERTVEATLVQGWSLRVSCRSAGSGRPPNSIVR